MYRQPPRLESIAVLAGKAHVVGLDVESGAVVWTYTPWPEEYRGRRTPGRVFVDGMRVFVLSDWLFCLDRLSGRAIWGRMAEPFAGGVIGLQGERLLATKSGYAMCVDARNGDVLWKRDIVQLVGAPTAIATDHGAMQCDLEPEI